jgi:hypothetical protein
LGRPRRTGGETGIGGLMRRVQISLGGDLDYVAQVQEAPEQGRAVEPRTGRPPKFDAAALASPSKALEAGPQAYGLPVTIRSIRDRRDVLAHRLGVQVCTATVHRPVQRLGYRKRRPRHDLRHRQDAEAVAGAKYVLTELQKSGQLPELDVGLFTWVRATCTPIPTWQRSGSGAGCQCACRLPSPISVLPSPARWTLPRGRCCGRSCGRGCGRGPATRMAPASPPFWRRSARPDRMRIWCCP